MQTESTLEWGSASLRWNSGVYDLVVPHFLDEREVWCWQPRLSVAVAGLDNVLGVSVVKAEIEQDDKSFHQQAGVLLVQLEHFAYVNAPTLVALIEGSCLAARDQAEVERASDRTAGDGWLQLVRRGPDRAD